MAQADDAAARLPLPVVEDDWLAASAPAPKPAARKGPPPPGLATPPPGLKPPPPPDLDEKSAPLPATPEQDAEAAVPTSEDQSPEVAERKDDESAAPRHTAEAPADTRSALAPPMPLDNGDDFAMMLLEAQTKRLLQEKSEAVANADQLARRVAQLEEQVRFLAAEADSVPWLEEDEERAAPCAAEEGAARSGEQVVSRDAAPDATMSKS